MGSRSRLRARIKKAFDEAGIEIPFPQRTVWIRNEDEAATAPSLPQSAGANDPSAPAMT